MSIPSLERESSPIPWSIVGLLLLWPAASAAQTTVLTYHNDNAHTGQNLTETQLTPANVNAASFGKLLNLPVDGKVDAQSLYVPALQIPGAGTHNVVFAATEHDSVYAFDTATGAQLWQVSLLKSGETPSDIRNCQQVIPEIGITGTPVIDLKAGAHGSIYMVAMSKDSAGAYHQRVHALDITSGAEEFGGPVDVQATYPGTGEDRSGSTVYFDPGQYKERTSLLLLNGVVYIGWSSHCDTQPYTSWLMGYNENTLAQTSVLNLEPNGGEGAIWGSGAGPVADANGNIFIAMANGTFDTTLNAQGFPNGEDFGNSFVRVTLNGGTLQVADYWTMYNAVTESAADQDLGSGGAVLLPDLVDANGQTRHLGMGAGKDANLYLFDRDNMGKFNPSNNSTLYQEVANGLANAEFGMPAWFNGTVYFGAVNDSIRAFPLSSARLAQSPSSKTGTVFAYPGTTPSISANGTTNAILWAVENAATGVLHAYDATDLTTELYNSNQAAGGRDQFGAASKFGVPTIADGKVFVGTQNSVAVFGLLQQPTAPTPVAATTTTLAVSPVAADSGSSVTLTAQVVSSSGAPTGTVTFLDGATPIGTAALGTNSTATLSTSTLAAGSHSVSASYGGAATFGTSASNAVTVMIVTPAAQVTFTVNPVSVPAGVTSGVTTMNWSAPSASTVEIHIGAPDGALFAQGGSAGTATTGDWVTNGMVFFLQDVSNGKALTLANTLAVASAPLQIQTLQGSLTISPNPIYAPYGSMGTATLNWSTSSASTIEVRVNAPNGPLLATGAAQGSATATGWVTNGMTFYLQDVSQGEVLTPAYTIAKVTAQVMLAPESGYLLAMPNPVPLSAGQLFGSATLNWNTSTASTVEIHIGSPSGPLFVRGGPQGTATASGWVANGLEFFLQDVSQAQPLTTQFTIATQTLSTATPQAGASFQASPNPVIVEAGAGLGSATLYWSAPSATTVEIHIGAPDGPLFAQGGTQGSATASGWVSDGLMFYLQDVSGGKPLTPANTLATVQTHLLIPAP
ncbi:MAG: Ig-like domain repeat protein [Bryobacteraceae bacterium]